MMVFFKKAQKKEMALEFGKKKNHTFVFAKNEAKVQTICKLVPCFCSWFSFDVGV
jgi:hypothetical protein